MSEQMVQKNFLTKRTDEEMRSRLEVKEDFFNTVVDKYLVLLSCIPLFYVKSPQSTLFLRQNEAN